jgi:hypothetical protein
MKQTPNAFAMAQVRGRRPRAKRARCVKSDAFLEDCYARNRLPARVVAMCGAGIVVALRVVGDGRGDRVIASTIRSAANRHRISIEQVIVMD